MRRPPVGVTVLALFFAFGAAMSTLAALALLLPHSALQAVWRINPEAKTGLVSLGPWAIALFLVVGASCAAAAVGLGRGAAWGRMIALAVLATNLLGDAASALYRGDLRMLVGIPIGAALIGYLLLNARVRAYFAGQQETRRERER